MFNIVSPEDDLIVGPKLVVDLINTLNINSFVVVLNKILTKRNKLQTIQ
jgi:hypothetical protein